RLFSCSSREKATRRRRCQLFHGKYRRRTSTRSRTRSSRRRANRRRLIALVLITLIAFVLMWLGSYLYNYQPEYYEPRDEQRK
ncbi:MAG: hypothetical protein O6826_05310, partial [Acidobacteria bacterium]|nr:hypothetical protein [Acidobacteriota bacterium]